jgi:hypothetical protein
MAQAFRKPRKVGIYLSEALVVRLRREVAQRQMSGSSIIECALEDFLEKPAADRQSILEVGGGALRRRVKRS